MNQSQGIHVIRRRFNGNHEAVYQIAEKMLPTPESHAGTSGGSPIHSVRIGAEKHKIPGIGTLDVIYAIKSSSNRDEKVRFWQRREIFELTDAASKHTFNIPSEKPAVNATNGAIELADELGVNVLEVSGSGINGRVSSADVRQFAEAKKASVNKAD